MTRSSVDAVHGSNPSINGKHSEYVMVRADDETLGLTLINRSQQDRLQERLLQDRAATRSSLHLHDPAEPINARLQNPLHVTQPARDAVSLHPITGAAPSVIVPKDTISAKDLAGIGDQFSAD
ncbi:hypothetical protein CEP54_006527 [Fusarium duplospermum]|uniref:Uncharacterized protein n=1 Tax=Fusarium duplospermum TaxID=1325734 RepID=A0A428Q6D6_9HYPO|nr:hypothetical protein CEP54_006527 [Fusarium duplospermum]